MRLDGDACDAGFRDQERGEFGALPRGRYECELYDAECKAELTATTHCGFHRYTFKQKDEARILLVLKFPLEYDVKIKSGEFKQVSPTVVEGYADMACHYGNTKLFYRIEFNQPFKRFAGWVNKEMKAGVDTIAGEDDVGAYVTYSPADGEQVLMRVGLSTVDIEGARNNLAVEFRDLGWDFDATARAARDQWNDLLSRIEVKGTERDLRRFYTNFYRSFAKQTWSDCDGRCVDALNRIQQVPAGRAMYGGDAFWNTFWNYNTILSLVATDIMNNWVRTQLELYDKVGWTNNGPTALKMTGIMEVTHEIALMVSAYQKGIRDYDPEKLYAAVRHNGTLPGERLPGERLPGTGLAGMERLDVYDRLGYVPFDVGAASLTLDYAYTDYCAAQLAKATGHADDYGFFLKRSQNWMNQFHPVLKMQVPRDSSGAWPADYDPLSGLHWIEGNGWQYTWYVPHDMPRLVSLLGRDEFNARLTAGFEKSIRHNFTAHAFDRHQEVAYEYYINHGNESNMQAAFLFNYSGKPWLAQKYSRMILDRFYGDTPYHGWEGDEDEGQMGGWSVIASMGLFEMDGGVTAEPKFDLVAPKFDEITIHLDRRYGGGVFTIKTVNHAPENIYIQSARLNGAPLNSCRLKFSDVVKGGRWNTPLDRSRTKPGARSRGPGKNGGDVEQASARGSARGFVRDRADAASRGS